MPSPRLVALTSSTHFFKSAIWTPDGTSLLTNSDDSIIRTYVLPPNLLTSSAPHTLTPYITLSFPTPITTLAIYPHHNLSDANTTLYLASLADHPIRLHNTLHTSLVASYPLIHAPTERYIAPASLLLTPDGRHFLAGADGLLASFDLSRNGEGPVTERKTNESTRGRKGDAITGMGMKGIVSAMSISTEGILAAGTFTRNMALYANEGQGEQIAVFPLTQQMGKADEAFIGGSGVTDVKWSPCGRYLYVAERQGTGVHVYDIRIAGRRVGVLKGRRAETTQRIGIDVVVPGGAASEEEPGAAEPSGQVETEIELEVVRQRALDLAATQDDSHDLEKPRYEDDDDTQDRSWRNARSSPVYDSYVETSQPSYDYSYTSSATPASSHSIISGGTDGIVRCWTNPHFVDGVLDPDDAISDVDSGWKASTDTLASVVAHPRMGMGVVATCSGSRHLDMSEDCDSDNDEEEERREQSRRQRDFSLKVWAI